MDNKKVIETIEKKLEVKVEKVLEVKQNGKEVIADVKVGWIFQCRWWCFYVWTDIGIWCKTSPFCFRYCSP